MPSSPFIALETINGIVRNVEGQVSSGGGFFISEESMQAWIAFFQKPSPDELERRE